MPKTERFESLSHGMPILRRSGLWLCLGLLAWAALSASVFGGVIPGRWEKLKAQPPGTSVTLTTRSGEVVTGLFQGLTRDAVLIVDSTAANKTVPKDAVLKVRTTNKVADPVGNGTAIGAVAGVSLAAASSGAGDLDRGAAIAFGGLFGAGLGFLIDKSLESQETLFVAP